MNFLDIRTVMFSQLITDAACAAVLGFLWLQNRQRFSGTFYWVVDLIFQTTAILLIILRGSVPDGISMGVSNTLVIAGALMGFWGLERFAGKKSSPIPNYILLAVFISVQFFFIYGKNDLDARTLNISAALLIVCIQCAWLMLRRAGRSRARITRAVGWVFVFFCLVSIIRIVILLAHPPANNDFFHSGLYDALALIAYQILLIMLAFSLALMVNQRLLVDVKNQEEKFAKAFHSSPYAILITRISDGLILDVNRGFEEMSGYLSSDVLGKTTTGLNLWVNPADRQVVTAELSAKGEVHGREFQFRVKSGGELTCLYYGEILAVNDERYVLSSISDITERKRAEKEVEHLASFPRLNPQPILEVDASGSITFRNPATLGVLSRLGLGDDARVFLPRDMVEILQNLSRQNESSLYREVAVAGAVFGERINMVSELNTVRIYASDITERKRAEEALEETLADLERSNTELEQFAYVASHDLQEPLRMVSRYTQLLAERYKGRLDGDADEFIGYAVDGATRMQRLIDDLLAYSRVGTQGKPPAPIPANLALDQALENLKLALAESKAEVKHEPLPTVSVDDVQLTQVFQNLIANAIKFRGEEPPRIRIAAEARGKEWVFSVRDNGIGIDPQHLERIFILFQCLNPRGKYPGTGIGLAMCKKIILRHGGRIWAESEPGKGSTFYFALPRTGGK
jgi:PAS domain S-box-containing protein